MIKVTEKCVMFQLRGRVYSLIQGCLKSDVCFSASGKHENFGYLVMIRVDNVGAIFMSSNIMTMSCTKHVDCAYQAEVCK